MSAAENIALEFNLDAPLGGPLTEDFCGIPHEALNSLARKYKQERSKEPKATKLRARHDEKRFEGLSDEQKEAQLVTEENVREAIGPGSIPGKEAKRQLDRICHPDETDGSLKGAAPKLHLLLAQLHPQVRRALQFAACELGTPELLETAECILRDLAAAATNAAQSYDPTNGGTTYNAHGPGTNNSALTNLVRLLAGLLEQQHRPVSHAQAGELYRLVSTVLKWSGDGGTASLSDSIRKALERA